MLFLIYSQTGINMSYLMTIILVYSVWIQNTYFEKDNSLTNGVYYGKSGLFYQYQIFVKVSNDTAEVDWFIKDFMIYKKLTDTLYKADNSTWKGKELLIIKNRNKIYITARTEESSFGNRKVPIRLNNNKSKEWEIFKNEAFLTSESSDLMKLENKEEVDSINRLINLMRIEVSTVQHHEFIIEFIERKNRILLNDD
jgi:hypothetical protein